MSANDRLAPQQRYVDTQVSHDDLIAFRQEHFSDDAITSFGQDFMNLSTPNAPQDTHLDNEWEEDDGLGYYDDGVKRTLTDDQIEIFRHSEIRELRRKQEKALKEKRPGDSENGVNAISLEAQDSDLASQLRQTKKKKKKPGKNVRQEPKPDLRKRTWDVVEAGLDTLDYD